MSNEHVLDGGRDQIARIWTFSSLFCLPMETTPQIAQCLTDWCGHVYEDHDWKKFLLFLGKKMQHLDA